MSFQLEQFDLTFSFNSQRRMSVTRCRVPYVIVCSSWLEFCGLKNLLVSRFRKIHVSSSALFMHVCSLSSLRSYVYDWFIIRAPLRHIRRYKSLRYKQRKNPPWWFFLSKNKENKNSPSSFLVSFLSAFKLWNWDITY